MRFHDDSASNAKPGTYSVYIAECRTDAGTCTEYVAVPYPYNSDLKRADEYAKAVAGDEFTVERMMYVTPQHRREALENSKEAFPQHFK